MEVMTYLSRSLPRTAQLIILTNLAKCGGFLKVSARMYNKILTSLTIWELTDVIGIFKWIIWGIDLETFLNLESLFRFSLGADK